MWVYELSGFLKIGRLKLLPYGKEWMECIYLTENIFVWILSSSSSTQTIKSNWLTVVSWDKQTNRWK